MSSSHTATTPPGADFAQHAAFVRALDRLVTSENLGALAALRRGLGRGPGQAPEMYPYVMPYLPDGTTPMEEEAYFLVAALFAWHQRDWTPADAGRDTSFGASFRQLREATKSDSTEQRFVALLNAHRDDLPEHLRHAIGQLKSKEIPVNWTALLRDILHWEDDNRSVQRKWARSFWRGHPAEPHPGRDQPSGREAS